VVFPDGASARSIVQMPDGIRDLLVEVTTKSRQFKGLKAAAGSLGAGSMQNVREAFLQLIFRALGLPENLSAARFILWLQTEGLHDKVCKHLKAQKLDPDAELRNFFVSTRLAEALVAADTNFGNPQNAQSAIRAQFPVNYSPTVDDCLRIIRQVFSVDGVFPCVLLVVDEIQQFIGDKLQRSIDVQEIVENWRYWVCKGIFNGVGMAWPCRRGKRGEALEYEDHRSGARVRRGNGRRLAGFFAFKADFKGSEGSGRMAVA
jgi:hypothetical protein